MLLLQTDSFFNKEGILAILGLVLFIAVCIALFILFMKSMKSPMANRIITLLVNIARIVSIFIFLPEAAEAAVSDDPSNMILFWGVLCIFTFILTLYGYGSAAFDDTRDEVAYTALDPIGNGGYKIVQRFESVGDSPLGNFLSAVFISAIFAGIMYPVHIFGTVLVGRVIDWLIPGLDGDITILWILFPLILSVFSTIRAVIFLIKYIRDEF